MKTETDVSSSHNKIQSVAALVGILAPIFYISVVIVLGLLEPGYKQRTMMISVLGGVQGWRGVAFNFGLVLIGLFLIVFGFGFRKTVIQGKGSLAGLILLVIAGIGLIGSSYFHCDVGCVNIIDEPDFRGQMHMLFAFIAGLGWLFPRFPFSLV